ncbi:MAG TPA: transcriptional regulator, partial [Bradyrhizobium sp.]
MRFLFTNHVLDIDRRELSCAGERVALEPQVFDVLLYLVQNSERVVSKDELFDKVWDGRIVSESTLTSRINAVRKAVNDNGRDQQLVRTVARKGFRFVGEVQAQSAEAKAAPAALPTAHEADHPRVALPVLDRTAIAVLPFV